ncbi:MAG: hyalin, partial [Actinomycetia bacterium]|nr:hyalin [Actinomycetes bacterium]
CPATRLQVGDSAQATFTASDVGSGLATPSSGTVALVTAAPGHFTATTSARDKVGHVTVATCSYVVNAPPTAPGAPELAAGSSSPNDGRFTLRWAAATDADGDPLVSTLLHANGGAYSVVAAATTTPVSHTFTLAAPEAAGTWTYEVRVDDGTRTTLSAPSAAVVVDRTPPVLTLPGAITVDATTAAGVAVSYAATATDAVDGPATVTCVPASGSVFAIGSTVVPCSATDRAGNVGTGYFVVTVRQYREQISALQAQIAAAAATATAPTSTRLRLAAAALADANKPIYWVDSLRLQPPTGGLVFLDLEGAVTALGVARGGSVPNATLDGWAAAAARIADALARTAVADAVAGHGVAAKIALAQTALGHAQSSLASGNNFAAIVYDATAWVLAEQAMKKLP